MSRSRLAVLWIAGSLLTVWLLCIVLRGPLTNVLVDRDFSNLWIAGRLVMEGKTSIVFDVEAFRNASHQLIGTTTPNAYSYPPPALFLAVPFALLPQPIAFFLWDVITAALFVWAARKHLPQGFPTLLAAFTPAALACYWYGHYGLLTGALFLFAFRGSGVAAALLTIKPHLGVLVAIQMLRDFRALVIAVATTLLLFAVSAAVFGLEAWQAFFTEILPYQASLLKPGAMLGIDRMMVTPALGYGILGWICFGLSGLIILSRNFNVWTAATATFLIIPYGFHYDMTVACLGFGVLAYSHWRDMKAWERAVTVIAFLSPELVFFGTRLIPPILLIGLYVQTRHPITVLGARRASLATPT